MQLRHRTTQELCWSSTFNTHSLAEILVNYEDDATSESLHDFDVLLETGPRAGQWVSLADAFKAVREVTAYE